MAEFDYDQRQIGKELQWIEAIEKVIDEEGRPLHYSDIAEMIVEKGYRTSVGARPAMTIQVILSNHFKANKDSAIVKVESGTYTLKKYLNKFDEISGSEKEQYIIQSFGIMWSRNLIHWKNNPDIYGIQSVGALPVNFAKQIGVYCLIDGRETIYVGQAFSQPIGERLHQHTKDRFSGRWDRFSWFGLYTIDDDGNLKITSETSRCVSLENMCHTLESILIEGIEPRQNRKSGNKFSGIEYNQQQDPVVERKHYMKMLDEIKDKLG
jgi:hypothetical protein